MTAGDELEAPVVATPVMRGLYQQARRLARAQVPVLVQGETGAGKEPVMGALHSYSDRRGSCVMVNCAAIAPGLLESELFGHERGAFTGAVQRRAGVFECAHQGTLCLDEIGDLGLAGQAALLRVLETGRVLRVGGTRALPVDVRVVAATHRDLKAMVCRGEFRQDLYYRLAAATLYVPPLRQRVAEIAPLAHRFLRAAGGQAGRVARGVSADALQALVSYPWPGNVRELRHAIERAAVLCAGDRIEPQDLPPDLLSVPGAPMSAAPPPSTGEAPGVGSFAFRPGVSFNQQLRAYGAYLLKEAVRHTGGRRGAAAELLGIPSRTFQRKVRELSSETR